MVRIFDEAQAALGPLSHVVNNAGITGKSSRLDEADAATIETTIDINVLGAIFVAREASRRLSRRHGGLGGSIVNISSIAARLGSAGEYVWYAASKGAVDALTMGLAQELASDGVRVNAVSPGITRTDIHERSTGDAGRVERLRSKIPLNRVGEPGEVAEAVLFLMSDAAVLHHRRQPAGIRRSLKRTRKGNARQRRARVYVAMQQLLGDCVLASDAFDLEAGNTKIVELAVGELRQLTDSVAITHIVADFRQNVGHEHERLLQLAGPVDRQPFVLACVQCSI